MTQRLLHAIIKVYSRKMSCLAKVSHTWPLLDAKVSLTGPLARDGLHGTHKVVSPFH
jgi:hypothetical protein